MGMLYYESFFRFWFLILLGFVLKDDGYIVGGGGKWLGLVCLFVF